MPTSSQSAFFGQNRVFSQQIASSGNNFFYLTPASSFADAKRVAFQIFFWLTSLPSVEAQIWGGYPSGSEGFFARVGSSGAIEVQCRVSSGSSGSFVSNASAVTTNTLYRLTVRYNSTLGASSRMVIYLNGSVLSSSIYNAPTLNANMENIDKLIIGGSQFGASVSDTPIGSPMTGQVFQPCIFSGASIPSVSALGNGSSPLNTQVLAAYPSAFVCMNTGIDTFGVDLIDSSTWQQVGTVPFSETLVPV